MAPIARFARLPTGLGRALIARRGRRLLCLWIGSRADKALQDLENRFSLIASRRDPFLLGVARALADPGRRRFPQVDAWWADSADLAVYRALERVTPGRTSSYGELARQAGTTPRRVGLALSRNRVLVAVPCHRVIRSDGTLGGYAGGPALKARLLEIERGSTAPMARARVF